MRTDDRLREEIFEFVLKEFPEQRYGNFGFDNHLLSLATELAANSAQYRRVEQILDERLEKLRKETDDYSFDFRKYF